MSGRRYNPMAFDETDPQFYFDGMIKCNGFETDIESCLKFTSSGMRCGRNNAASVICKYD